MFYNLFYDLIVHAKEQTEVLKEKIMEEKTQLTLREMSKGHIIHLVSTYAMYLERLNQDTMLKDCMSFEQFVNDPEQAWILEQY